MSNLIDQYENQSEQAQPRILENDLDSFWDMIYIQVALMYKKFDRLKQLKTDQWIDKEEEERKRKQEAKMAKNKTAVRTRAQRMEDYRQEKLKRREEIRKKTLPPFRAGIVHHTLDSPYKYFNGKESAPPLPPPPSTAATSTAFKVNFNGLYSIISFTFFHPSKRTQLGTSTATEQPTEDKDDTKVFSGVFFHIESPVSNKVQKKVTLSSPAVKKQNPKQASIMNMLAVSPLAKSLAATSLVEVTTDATASEMRRGILKKTVERDQGGEGMKKKSTGRKSRGGKKICFSLVEPESAGEEPYFTPPQTPKRAIRKTPHKPPKSNHTDSEPNHTDNEPNHTNSEHMEVSPTLATLENQRPTRVSRTPQTKSARVSKTPQLGDENNSNLLNLSEESRKSPRRSKTPQKESPKTVLIGGENNNLLSVTEEFLRLQNPESRKSPRRSKTPHKESPKTVLIGGENNNLLSVTEEFPTHKSPRGSKTPQKGSAKLSRTPPKGRNSPLLSIPADYLPRKSPRMSKAPERLTLDDFRITPKKSKRNFVLRPSRLSVKNACT
ncbi:neurofilament heavy polypeptide-like [Diaphorina citri]|uniref:Neurofilament heavy polypeptide-like n=1 Tax=Diaphorina citri TaxID=121845 RepID=A0A1S4ECA9_DIACI|nr:neurofilament heavy polypeptide-like [Diaphorina citri]